MTMSENSQKRTSDVTQTNLTDDHSIKIKLFNKPKIATVSPHTLTMDHVVKGSQDSEDGIRIGASSAESQDEMSDGNQRVRPDAIKPSSPTNGQQDPRQRRIYLSLLAFSVFNALLGLSLILVWMFKFRPVTGLGVTTAGQLSNLHPVLMFTFMVSLNMYAILIYRTHYNQPKQRLKWAHAILSGLNIVMSLLGVAAMYKAHLMANIGNFYSLHSWIGIMTNTFYFTQFLFGFIAFLKPGLAIERRQQLMPWHRLAGTGLLVLASLAAITGIAELVIFQDKDGAYQKFTPITFIANFAGISIVLMTATSVYLVTSLQFALGRVN